MKKDGLTRKTTVDCRNFANALRKGVKRMYMCVGNFMSQILQSKLFAKTTKIFSEIENNAFLKA